MFEVQLLDQPVKLSAEIQGISVANVMRPATRSTLGAVIIGEGLNVNTAGVISTTQAAFLSDEDFLAKLA